MLSIFTGTGSRTNAIKDTRISKSTFYLNKAITELHIVKPEVFQQEVHSAITNNLQLSELSLRWTRSFESEEIVQYHFSDINWAQG